MGTKRTPKITANMRLSFALPELALSQLRIHAKRMLYEKEFTDKLENYIKKQEEENDFLETKIVCSTMVIRK